MWWKLVRAQLQRKLCTRYGIDWVQSQITTSSVYLQILLEMWFPLCTCLRRYVLSSFVTKHQHWRTLQAGRLVMKSKQKQMKCACDKGWTSENCGIPICRGLGANGCGGHGMCSFVTLCCWPATPPHRHLQTYLQALVSVRIFASAVKVSRDQIAALSR